MKPTVSDTQQLAAIGQAHLAHQRVERHEQRVGRDGVLVRQPVEQRRLAGVRVADERDGRHRLLLAPLAKLRPPLPHLLDLALDRLDARANAPAIGLELRFAGAARADAAAEPRQRRPRSGEPRQQVFQLRQLHLPLAFTRSRAAREDVEDQLRSIDDLALEPVLELAQLAGRQLVVEDDHVHVGFGAGCRQARTLPVPMKVPASGFGRSCSIRSTTEAPAASARPRAPPATVRRRCGGPSR